MTENRQISPAFARGVTGVRFVQQIDMAVMQLQFAIMAADSGSWGNWAAWQHGRGARVVRRFEVVSLDMFQTLVDVGSRTCETWRPILGEQFTEAAAHACAGELLEHFFRNWDLYKNGPSFSLMRLVYKTSFRDHSRLANMEYDCDAAVARLFEQHKNAEQYEETAEFLERITGSYRVCIVSDADDDMVPDFHRSYPFTLFTSERSRSYKNDSRNAMFGELLHAFGVPPDKVIHVGDSVSDVLGARRAGIASCWLNRDAREWELPGMKPDYTIRRLDELYDILEEKP